MKKILSLVLVLTMVLGSFSFVAAAPADDFARLIENEILIGDGNGNFNWDGTLTRAQYAVIALRLAGFADAEVVAANEAHPFTDSTGWESAYVGKAYKEGLVAGTSTTTYSPADNVTYVQALTVLMRALGYKDGSDLQNWPTGYMVKAVELGLANSSIAADAEITNAQMAATMELTLDAKLKGQDITLAQKLGIEEVVVVPPTPETLEVVSVSATNLKEVVVVFNQEVDEDTVKAANFSLTDVDVLAADLEANGTTVVLTVETMENQEEYELTVEKVKTVAGVEIELTTVEFSAFDTALPEILSVVVTGPSSLQINFSEPMQNEKNDADNYVGDVEVKTGSTTVGVNITNIDGRKVEVEVYATLEDGKTYDVTVRNFEDFAGYKNIMKTIKLAYVEDKTPPTAAITKVDQTNIVVEFNKPVVGITEEHFYHTFTSWMPEGVYEDAEFTTPVDEDKAYSKVYVRFFFVDEDDNEFGYPLPEGNVSVTIRGKGANNGVEIMDNWDNKFATTTLTVSVAADKETPEVKSLKAKNHNTLEIEFSKNVKFNADNVEVLDKDGKEISGVSVSVSTPSIGKKFTIGLVKDLTGETIVVRIKDVEDSALTTNTLKLYTATIEIGDTSFKGVEAVRYTDEVGKEALYVFYKEAVNNTALSKDSYLIYDGSTYTKVSKQPAFAGRNTIVRIPLTAAELEDVLAGSLVISRVEDLAGNTFAGYQVTRTISALSDKIENYSPKVDKIEVVGTKTIEITFDQILTSVNRLAFEVMGSAPAAMSSTTVSSNTKTKLILTTVDTITHDATNLFDEVTGDLLIQIVQPERLKNQFGAIASTDMIEVVAEEIDKIAPALAKYASNYAVVARRNKEMVDVTGVATYQSIEKANQITITYREAIDPASVSRLTFTVETATVDSVIVSEDGLTIEINFTPKNNMPVRPRVTQVYDITDMAGNTFRASSAIQPNAYIAE